MPEPTKRCSKCGRNKALLAFGRRPNGVPQSRCKACHTAAAKQERERTGNRYGRAYNRARRRATLALIDAHLDEFEELLRTAKRREGLNADA